MAKKTHVKRLSLSKTTLRRMTVEQADLIFGGGCTSPGCNTNAGCTCGSCAGMSACQGCSVGCPSVTCPNPCNGGTEIDC